ncbi:hypothetical protein ACU635_43630 [[Actinomadura] parvosata]|uniref:hypothetical protein n=1 Tax=[Actinomadura] parvosata TaxID=1955412 RepID=UPI00406C536F
MSDIITPIPGVTIVHDGLPAVANWRIIGARYLFAGRMYEVAWGDEAGQYFVYRDDERIAEFSHERYIDSDAFRCRLVEQALKSIPAAPCCTPTTHFDVEVHGLDCTGTSCIRITRAATAPEDEYLVEYSSYGTLYRVRRTPGSFEVYDVLGADGDKVAWFEYDEDDGRASFCAELVARADWAVESL